MQKTLTIIKNESVKRGLVGEIIKKIESTGLRISKILSVKPSLKQATSHYVKNEKWIRGLGEKARKSISDDKKCLKIFGTVDESSIGEIIYKWSIKQLMASNVVIVVWEGANAVEKVKKIVGDNEPSKSDLSTIRGQYSAESYKSSILQKRALYNVVHRSTSTAEAKREIKVWF